MPAVKWLIAMLMILGCAAPPTDDDSSPTAEDLPDGPPAEISRTAHRACASPDGSEHLPFVDVTAASGVGFETATYDWPPPPDSYNTLDVEMTGGFVVGDLDGDGRHDLLFTDGAAPPRLFLGDGALGFAPADLAARGIPADRFLTGASAADVDGDGDLDVLLLARTENVLLRNDGAGVFGDATAETGLGGGAVRSAAAAWADYDGDGDLDVYVANHGAGSGEAFSEYEPDRDALFQQQDDGTFVDRIDDVLAPEDDGHGFIGGWIDADGDGLQDLYVVNDLANGENGKPGNVFVRNLGGGLLERAPGAGLDLPMLGMGLAIGDMDGDGDPDLHVSNVGATLLARNDSSDAPLFTDLSLTVQELTERPIGDVSWSTFFFDHDNDGALELFTAYGQLVTRYDFEDGGPEGSTNAPEQQDTLLRWDPVAERFGDEAPWVGINDPARTRTAAAVDLDGDGFAELVTWALYRGPRLWASGCTTSSSLTVRLEDSTSPNRDAVGATVEAWADGARLITRTIRVGSTGVFGSTPPAVSLGLGSRADVGLVVTWPDGAVTVNPGVPTGASVVVRR